MSKTKTYMTILVAAIAIIVIGFIMNINMIKSFVMMCFEFAGNNIQSVAAAICAFIFLGNKNYWLIMLGCAIITALAVQVVVMGQSAGILILTARVVTFMAIVFLMNFAKLLINK